MDRHQKDIYEMKHRSKKSFLQDNFDSVCINPKFYKDPLFKEFLKSYPPLETLRTLVFLQTQIGKRLLYPSRAYLASEKCLCVTTITRHTNRLVKDGLLIKLQCSEENPDGTYSGRSNLYRLNPILFDPWFVRALKLWILIPSLYIFLLSSNPIQSGDVTPKEEIYKVSVKEQIRLYNKNSAQASVNNIQNDHTLSDSEKKGELCSMCRAMGSIYQCHEVKKVKSVCAKKATSDKKENSVEINRILQSMPKMEQLRLTKWGRIKLLAFPNHVLSTAYKEFLSSPATPHDPFAHFFSIVNRTCEDSKVKPDWEQVDFLKKVFKMPVNAQTTKSREDGGATPHSVYAKATSDIKVEPDLQLLEIPVSVQQPILSEVALAKTEEAKKPCSAIRKGCICTTCDPSIACICGILPNKRCTGLERSDMQRYHPKAAYEHFEKFKNKTEFQMFWHNPEFNPFKQEYDQWLSKQ